MSVLNHARVIIYRINKKGLEIFLVKDGNDSWQIPQGMIKKSMQLPDQDKLIELDPSECDGEFCNAYAIECDWHEIPSVRAIIKEDVKIVKDQIKARIPNLEQGTYFAVKEAFKQVMPNEYSFLKELKDVIIEKNQAKYI